MTTTARGRRQNALLDRFQRGATAFHKVLLKASKGRFGAKIGGNPVVVLTVTGRTSKQPRSTPIFGYPDGDGWLIVASNGGAAESPQWFKNLEADPHATITADGVTTAVTATVLSEAAKAEVWPRLVGSYKPYAAYQRKTDRPIPVVRFAP